MEANIKTYKIRITGLVQGVGFRPFIYRIAHENNVLGTVDNRNDGVLIFAESSLHNILNFVKEISSKAPQAANIENIVQEEIPFCGYSDFQIVKSTENSDPNQVTEISPDIAVCSDCLEDMKSQSHRIDYPFINCTNCGPRFTIIQNLPYDRHQTTMSVFPMCPECEKEYKDVLDRRFHAQPVACNHCGPHYTLEIADQKTEDIHEILSKVSHLIDESKVLAMKGLGGFHIMCDAFSSFDV
jgi:hydrogenase maturation protein HypF